MSWRWFVALSIIFFGCKSKTTEPTTGGGTATYIYIYTNRDGTWDIYKFDLSSYTLTKLVGTNYDEKYPYIFNGKIYFSANDDGDYDIYLSNEDGTNRTKITNLPGDELEPVLSPDGRYIAFSWNGLGGGGFVVVLFDTQTNDTVKTFGNTNSVNTSPYFISNDTLLMTLQDYEGVYSQDLWMYVISADTLIHVGGSSSHQESYARYKNGKIAYAKMDIYGGNPSIAVSDFPFSNEQVIYTDNVRSLRPVWNPDGSSVAFSLEGLCKIVNVSLDGSVVETLYSEQNSECYTYFWR